MKKQMVCLAMLVLAGCAAQPAQDAEQNAMPTPTAAEETVRPLYWVDNVNQTGYYEMMYSQYRQDGTWASCLDFAEAEERRVDAPEAVNRAEYHTQVLADDTYLYWLAASDFGTTPVLMRTDLNGQNGESVPLPQNWYLNAWEGMACDGDAVYLQAGEISDTPTVRDEKLLVRADFSDGSVTTLAQWDDFGGRLAGVWQDTLLFTRIRLDEDCPTQPVVDHYNFENYAELLPYMTVDLCALDPVTGQESLLQSGAPMGSYHPVDMRDGFWWHIDAEGRLMRQAVDGGDEVAAELPEQMSLIGVYDEDVMLCDVGGTTLYVYNREGDTLSASPLHCARKNEKCCPWVLCQTVPGGYLIQDGESPVTRTAYFAGTASTFEGIEKHYALASREALLNETVATRPIKTAQWHID